MNLPQPQPNNPSTDLSNNGGTDALDEVHSLVLQLVTVSDPKARESILLELAKKRESWPDLAPVLWHTTGAVAIILQEITRVYEFLSPPTLTRHASKRVCNALAILQCVASHLKTRGLFFDACIPLYIYPFLDIRSKDRPFEYMRITSLVVIGSLVKNRDNNAVVIRFLLETGIIPLCLRIMKTGSESSTTVATFIFHKILLDKTGLFYACATEGRFYAVSSVLNSMIAILVNNPNMRMLKEILRCYLRLSDNLQARNALRQCLPLSLRDNTFDLALREDATAKKWLTQLLTTVGPPLTEGGGNGLMEGSAGGGIDADLMGDNAGVRIGESGSAGISGATG